MNLDSTTVFTYTDIRTVGSCFTVQDVPYNFCLFRRGRILFKICRIKTLENILNRGLIHNQHLLSCQTDFEFPSEICC